MSDGTQQRGQPRPPTALSEFRLRLIGDAVNGSNRAPTLGFGINKNNPEIVVRTNVEGDKDYGRITAKLSTADFFAIFAALEDAIPGPANTKQTITLAASRFMNGKPSDSPMVDSKVIIGKDKDGILFIAVTSWEKDRPIIKFPFRPSNDKRNATTWVDNEGQALSAERLSMAYARGWLKILGGMIPYMLITQYVAPPPRDNGGGGGGGNRGGGGNQWGGNRGGGGGGGGYSKPAVETDNDDFPM